MDGTAAEVSAIGKGVHGELNFQSVLPEVGRPDTVSPKIFLSVGSSQQVRAVGQE